MTGQKLIYTGLSIIYSSAYKDIRKGKGVDSIQGHEMTLSNLHKPENLHSNIVFRNRRNNHATINK